MPHDLTGYGSQMDARSKPVTPSGGRDSLCALLLLLLRLALYSPKSIAGIVGGNSADSIESGIDAHKSFSDLISKFPYDQKRAQDSVMGTAEKELIGGSDERSPVEASSSGCLGSSSCEIDKRSVIDLAQSVTDTMPRQSTPKDQS